MNLEVFVKSSHPGAVIFLSGAGTNAEKLLKSPACGSAWTCRAIVTDRPTGAGAELAKRYGLPLIDTDIRRFYAEHGLASISIASREGFAVRELWTDRLRELLKPYRPDFGILAGFIPLTNIVADFPCLNVHPGDLTVEKDGRRRFVGLHEIPVREAILAGMRTLRSSVLIATPFTPGAQEMDSGYLPGISAPVPVELPENRTLAEIAADEELLKETALRNLENLKRRGDWIVFPKTVEDFASGRFAHDCNGSLWYLNRGNWEKIRAVEYGAEKNRLLKISDFPA